MLPALKWLSGTEAGWEHGTAWPETLKIIISCET